MGRIRVGIACSKHGYFSQPECPRCASQRRSLKRSTYINTDKWVEGWYEHIGPEPIYIESKKHLIHECEKRGCFARALIKPKSSEKGYEHKKH